MGEETNMSNLKMVQRTVLEDGVRNYKFPEGPKSSFNRNHGKIGVRNFQLGPLLHSSVGIGGKFIVIMYWYREGILFLIPSQHPYT